MMHLADQSTPDRARAQRRARQQDLSSARRTIRRAATQDREVVSFDGRVLILRWMDPEVQGRYGTMVYVRCGAGRRQATGQAEGQAESRSRSRQPAAAATADPARRIRQRQ